MKLPTLNTLSMICGLMLLAGVSFGQCNFEVSATISPEVPGNIYCTYDTISLSVTDTFDSYQWYFNFSNSNQGGTAIAGATQRILKTTAGEYGFVYFYAEASRDNCTDASDPIVVDIWAFLSPVIVSYPEHQYCRGDSSMIAIGTGVWASIQWYQDGTLIPGATDSIFWVRETGIYVVFASPGQCPELELSSGLGPDFIFEGPEVPVISQQDTVLLASSGPNYQWFQDGEVITGATAQSYTPTQSGNYSVRVSDGSGCTADSAPFFYMLSATGQPLAKKIVLAPNPASDLLMLHHLPPDLSRVDILNAKGQLLRQVEVDGAKQLQIGLGDLTAGTYFCRIHLKGTVTYRRFVRN